MNPRAGFRSGYAAIVGPPNTGKSTLLNRLLGQKISITAKKAQTTRNRILGVLHRPNAQIVFTDTPGVHSAHRGLNKRMVEAAQNAAAEADLILWTEDVTAGAADRKHLVDSRLFPPNRPVILVLNKIDRVSSERVLTALSDWAGAYEFTAQLPVSALVGTNLDRLISVMESNLAEGPPFFPEDTVTDQPMRFIAAELIREKLFRLTGKEIPYAAAVTVETFSEEPDRGLASIRAVIHLERESQKGIVIGKAGGMLKKIGQAARHELEEMMDRKVYLELFVRVEKNWSKDENALSRLGYR